MRKRGKVKFVITLLLILNILLISGFPAKVSASESEVNAIVNSAKSKLYSSAYDGLCQAFVKSCYEAAGIYSFPSHKPEYKGRCNGILYGESHRKWFDLSMAGK